MKPLPTLMKPLKSVDLATGEPAEALVERSDTAAVEALAAAASLVGIDRVRELGYDDRFLRIWTFYLAYCEAAFDTGNTDVVQFTLRQPAA